MKWYNVPFGVMGYIPDEKRWQLFESDSAYFDYIKHGNTSQGRAEFSARFLSILIISQTKYKYKRPRRTVVEKRIL